ncbi:hypothetical protein QLS71_007405 [Mariniflexile litorale]|uniref:Uncharacterized protein n=1 Tax=Mariniflexile litorale TaxID=3045158 RepID=A0AAU7EKD8_9FLAO|nr:hypothetical protein [Mariniflexile sp. KMM 9835]MDQ8211226.1 hypothetical protein [Mariniflexile sp. KMM 9835]
MDNHNKQPKSLNGQGEVTKKTTNVLFIKEVQETLSFERMMFECSRITGHDENGNHLQTCEGNYKVYWHNGKLSFDRPLKLEPFVSPFKNLPLNPLDVKI